MPGGQDLDVSELLPLALFLCFWTHGPCISALSYSQLFRDLIFKHSAHVSEQESPYATAGFYDTRQGQIQGVKAPS